MAQVPAPGAALHPGLRGIRAVVFDTDGVITDSARLHAQAWKEAFDACLRERPPADPAQRRPFDSDDYRRHVDGKSRLDGAAAFLASRGLRLPPGEPDDPPGTATVRAVAARKEQLFVELLRSGVDVWPGSVRLLDELRRRDVPCAAVSASRHARELLGTAGLLHRFAAVVDGVEAARLGLPGKPDPALFLEAARRLGPPPADTAVVEDALPGVEAGRRGRFGLVVGVNRTGTRAAADDLLAHGADIAVDDLADLIVPASTAVGLPGTPTGTGEE